MIYRAIGLMSGSSLDGLDIVLAEFSVQANTWTYEIKHADCYPYSEAWKQRLGAAISLNARDYMLLDAEYGHYLGREVSRFIEENNLHYQAALIASHGHTSFHLPVQGMTAQLGLGAAIAAETALPVISDLRAMDVALGGQGAPIVPIGEQLLFPQHKIFLNLGGIANISFHRDGTVTAFDICPANRVLNLLAALEGKAFDENGVLAAGGAVHQELLSQLNALEYYGKGYPKSLANDFGTDVVFPLIQSYHLPATDALRTFVAHIVEQVVRSLEQQDALFGESMLVTGGGAFNQFLVNELERELSRLRINVSVPDAGIVMYKEALVMALMGVLRWRQQENVLASVTGASRDSVNGAIWMGSAG